MAKPLGPIKPDETLTLVDHLDELRSRLIACVVVFVAVFAVCLWQSQAILDFVNAPMERSQRAAEIASEDPLALQAAQSERTAAAMSETAAALHEIGDSLAAISADGDADKATAEKVDATRESVTKAAASLEAAAEAVPEYDGRKPITLGVAEPFMTSLTVAGYAALLLSLPFLLYQLYAFILPAFTPSERRVALPLMIAIPGLFVVGAVFTYLVVLPGAVGFLQSFNAGSFDVLLQAKTYYKFAVLMMLGIGLLFQIPVVVLVITRLGIVTPAQLRRNRGYVILGVVVLAALGNGSPDPFTMVMVALPLIALFELSVAFAAWLDRSKDREEVGPADNDAGEAGNPE